MPVTKKRIMGLVGVLTLFLSGCATLNGGSQQAVLRAKDKVAPALVHIRPVKEVFSRGKREEMIVTGSGFIISPDGYVITNEHVAGESSSVRCVLYNKEEVDAKVVGVDPYTDIAVLKLEGDTDFPYVKMGDSDSLEAGAYVLALGSPHGLSRSVSMGIISVTDRKLDNAPYNTFLQTDAAINPGNSGGPLVNLKGEVVGVNARKLTGADNLGFAIPINVGRQVAEAIIAEGRMRRSWLGLSLQEMRAKTDDPAQRGVVIADVDPLSPANEAGVRPGDVLQAVNGTQTHARFSEELASVRKAIADLPVGESVEITVQRGEETLIISMVTEEKSQLKGDQVEFAEWGFTAAELTPAIVRRAQLTSRNGILISGTQVGGPADLAGLYKGDILLEMDEKVVENLTTFQRGYAAALESQQSKVLFFVKSGALTRFVLLRQDDTSGTTEEGVNNAE